MSLHPSNATLPTPAHGRGALIAAVVALAAGAAILLFALHSGDGSRPDRILRFPSSVVVQPRRIAPAVKHRTPKATPARPTVAQQQVQALQIGMLKGRTHITAAWAAGFYAIYAQAAKAFAVNPLLIASVHKQESAFSTAPTTYHGLNFAGCCAGPMQFNVTNGPVSTWDRFRTAFRYGTRPKTYDHPTATHPSVYDDYDAVMAGAWLLRASGAGAALDATAWQAAYDYYGHDATGVSYADQVLARAQGWARDGFCVNCAVDPALVAQADADYGVAARVALTPPPKRKRSHPQTTTAHAPSRSPSRA